MRRVNMRWVTGCALAGASVLTQATSAQAPAAARAGARPVTFTRDVAPILQRSCQNCHRPDSMAPMSFLTYEDVRPWARAIKQKVSAREMPPVMLVRSISFSLLRSSSVPRRRGVTPWSNNAAK